MSNNTFLTTIAQMRTQNYTQDLKFLLSLSCMGTVTKSSLLVFYMRTYGRCKRMKIHPHMRMPFVPHIRQWKKTEKQMHKNYIYCVSKTYFFSAVFDISCMKGLSCCFWAKNLLITSLCSLFASTDTLFCLIPYTE